MARPTPVVEHLLRRAAFGATVAERNRFATYPYLVAVNALTEFDLEGADVDDRIGVSGYVGINTGGRFQPNLDINQARQRWLFRMVHSPAPLREKMALFWHHHFATGFNKVASDVGTTVAARMMDAKPSEDPAQAKGQIELFREHALGNFRELLVAVARDSAMLYWLDNRLNTRLRPQENFARELMELFTLGVQKFTEPDVYAAARVFTGWNVTQVFRGTDAAYITYFFNAAQHDTDAKEFSFPIYSSGSNRIDPRSGASGEQDGIDLIAALASHPETARRMARKLWTWFVSETREAPDDFVESISSVYLRNDTNMKPVIRAVLLSPHFTSEENFYQRYAWPVEYVVRALKEVGFVGFSVSNALNPLVNMGQQLYEPPDVNGWATGTGWFSTAAMLSRMNFASVLATNQRFELRTAAQAAKGSPDSLVDFTLDRLTVAPGDDVSRGALINYVNTGGAWSASDTQVLNKTGGLFHLVAGSGSYQLI